MENTPSSRPHSIAGAVLAGVLLAAAAAADAQQDPRTLPLLERSNLVYVGSFAMPNTAIGTSRFSYGGQAVAAYNDSKTGKRTLYISGHLQNPGHVAQVEIPAELSKSTTYAQLPVAKVLQPFASVLDGSSLSSRSGITTGDGGYLYGMLAMGERLIVSAAEYYGCTQTSSHGASQLDLAAASDFKGFFRIEAAANARTVGGPMMPIPPEWQSLMGGTAFTGNWGLPIVSCNSAGPALTAFHPEQVGGTGAITGSTMLHYPLQAGANRSLCVGDACLAAVPEATTNELYNLSSRFGGAAFPAGTRSVLFFGRHGTGRYCYGTPDECGGDPAEPDSKGPHAYPYRYQVWAYDANDLLKVKAGTMKTWEPRPYAVWAVHDIDGFRAAGTARISGAGYDAETRRWYITTDYGERPRVDVFEIQAPTALRGQGRPVSSLSLVARRDAAGSAVSLSVPGSAGAVRYRVYDNGGRRMADLSSEAADGAASWDASRAPAGVYVVRAEVQGAVLDRRLALGAGRF